MSMKLEVVWQEACEIAERTQFVIWDAIYWRNVRGKWASLKVAGPYWWNELLQNSDKDAGQLWEACYSVRYEIAVVNSVAT